MAPRGVVRALPNALTVLRVAGALAFPFVPLAWRGPAAVGIGLTDALDGWIARRWDAASRLGALLDGFADKLFTLVVLATLLWDGLLSPWAAAGILARDLCVLGIVLLAAAHGELRRAYTHCSARRLGKATTLVVFSWFGLVLFFQDARTASAILTGVAVLLSAAAGVDYVARFALARAEWRAEHPSSPPG